jgi:putative tryptophan/tyrosine transport system substrate-binding protein
MIDRRTFLAGTGAVLLAAPLAAQAQQASKIYRVGVVANASPPSAYVDAFREGLRELGYVEGRNIGLEVRYTEGRMERLPALMSELVRLNVDVIVAGGGAVGARVAKQATKTIPIVSPAMADPIAAGLVASLARPGGNLTGLSMLNTELSSKRLELLKAASPKVTVVAILRDPAVDTAQLKEAERATRTLGLHVEIVDARAPSDFPAAFADARKRRADAMVVLASSFFNSHRDTIVKLAATSRLAAIYEQRDFTEAGGLMSYGPKLTEMYRRAATYVDKILKGAKPADLPVEQPTKFELVINLKTAKALGLTIPPSLLGRADEVIQ